MPSPPIVCVDFNGVLDSYTGWHGPQHFDPPALGGDLKGLFRDFNDFADFALDRAERAHRMLPRVEDL